MFSCIFVLISIFLFNELFYVWKMLNFLNTELYVNQVLQVLFKNEFNYMFLILLFYFCCFCVNIHFKNWFFTYTLLFYNIPSLVYSYSNIYTYDKFIINDKLINGLFIIHPLLTYLFYSGIMLGCFFSIRYITVAYKDVFNIIFSFNLNRLWLIFNNYLCIGLVALTLGSWWAQQEINWNGWWGWDFVEVLNLVFFIYGLKILHCSVIQNYLYKCRIFISYAILVLVYMLCLRFSLFNSLHTFLGTVLVSQIFVYLYLFVFVLMHVYFYFLLKNAILSIVIFKRKFAYYNILFFMFSIVVLIVNYCSLYIFFYVDSYNILKEFFVFLIYTFVIIIFDVFSFFIIFIFNCFLTYIELIFIVSLISLLFLNFYKFSRLLHAFIYLYACMFITSSFVTSFVFWDKFSYMNSIYFFKSVLTYNTFFEKTFDCLFTNYIQNALFSFDSFLDFFSELKLFFKNAFYVSHDFVNISLFLLDNKILHLFFYFIDKLYNLFVCVVIVILYIYIKRKKYSSHMII